MYYGVTRVCPAEGRERADVTGQRVLPDTPVLQDLVRQGWTYNDIAAAWDVGPQAVYRQMQRAGKAKTRPDYSHIIPWRVATQHNKAAPIRYLRMLGRRQAGETLTPAESRRLDKWLAELREAGVVVAYERDYPPNEASMYGGFYYSRRRESDGVDALVRMPEQAEDDG